MQNIWKVHQKAPKKHLDSFSEYSPTQIQLLYNRNLKSQDEIDEFFNPDFNQDLHDPFLLKDMERAVERILAAVESKQRVAIYGDYDADGVTAASILTELMKALGLKGQIYIPDRKKEGYGLNKKAIDWLVKKKVELIITCDCGVSDREEIDYAKEKYDLDTVVFDHHEPPSKFSKDYIIVDAKRKGDKYPFNELCAAGVAFKVAEAFFRHRKKALKVKNKEAFIKWLLDLVAIGTVADCVPLLYENRTLLKYGLKVIQKTKRPGLKSLFSHAGMSGPIESYHLGFLVGPRINAAGRIDHANVGYKLLVSKNKSESEELAAKLERTNSRRQNLTAKVFEEAEMEIKKEKKLQNIVIVSGKEWPIGVIGIVAGKLSEKYARPVIVFGKGRNYVGSGRGPINFNLVEAISDSKELLLEYGGHQQAAGLTVTAKNFKEFKKKIEAFARRNLSKKDLAKTIDIDRKVSLKEITWDLYKEIEKLAPYGEANPEPIFLAEKLKITALKNVGKEAQHLKLSLSDQDGNSKAGIAFNHAFEEININDLVDVVYNISVNEWNGNRSLELKIIDLKKSGKDSAK